MAQIGLIEFMLPPLLPAHQALEWSNLLRSCAQTFLSKQWRNSCGAPGLRCAPALHWAYTALDHFHLGVPGGWEMTGVACAASLAGCSALRCPFTSSVHRFGCLRLLSACTFARRRGIHKTGLASGPIQDVHPPPTPDGVPHLRAGWRYSFTRWFTRFILHLLPVGLPA